MDDCKKDSASAITSDQWDPILPPFELPKDKECFTAKEIMKYVESFFDFKIVKDKTAKDKTAGSMDKDKSKAERVEYSNKEGSVRQHIRRKIESIPHQKDSAHKKQINKYSRKDVEDYFNSEDTQLYFWNVSIQYHQGQIDQKASEVQRCNSDPQANSPNNRAKKKKLEEEKASEEEALSRARANKKQIEDSPERRKELYEANIRCFDDEVRRYTDSSYESEIDVEIKVAGEIQQFKEKILFDVLFNSLIDFDEELLRKDLLSRQSIEDNSTASYDQIQDADRLKKLSNYYKKKFDLVDIFRILYEIGKKSQKPNFNTFKEED